MTTRRTFLARSSLALAGVGLGLPRLSAAQWEPRSHVDPEIDPAIYIGGTDVRALALHAVDAAKSAGATYADVRVTRTLWEYYSGGQAGPPRELRAIGVRALVNGYWGFAAAPYWTMDDAAWLANDAVSQARIYARGTPRTVVWEPRPAVTGSWTTPVRVDPFTIPIEEKSDHAEAWLALARQYDRRVGVMMHMSFSRQERALATTDGTYLTQTTYESGGDFMLGIYTRRNGEPVQAFADATGLDPAGAGWELFADANLVDQLPGMVAQADAELRGYPSTPGDIGRYDIVLDGRTMASLVAATLGTPTQLDRALGYEANATGTSYLGPDPLALLGTPVASPLVTLTADRAMPRGLATVGWDDEAVKPEPFTLVKDGVLTDYQTTREQAAWLEPWYIKKGMPVQSHGCAGSNASGNSALKFTMQHMPNLVLQPGPTATTFDDLVASTKRGLAIVNGRAGVDVQGKNGLITPGKSPVDCREIIDGKLGRSVTSLVPSFSSPDLWKHVAAIGGRGSEKRWGSSQTKGEPTQYGSFSVSAVPAKVTNVICIDPSRRA